MARDAVKWQYVGARDSVPVDFVPLALEKCGRHGSAAMGLISSLATGWA
jgi:hypothetical protein